MADNSNLPWLLKLRMAEVKNINAFIVRKHKHCKCVSSRGSGLGVDDGYYAISQKESWHVSEGFLVTISSTFRFSDQGVRFRSDGVRRATGDLHCNSPYTYCTAAHLRSAELWPASICGECSESPEVCGLVFRDSAS